LASSSAAEALLSTSPRLVVAFWITDQRAALGTKNWCSSGSSVSMPSLASSAHSSSKRSDRRFRNSRPKMKLL
jgi:hypothetical protein